MGKLFDVENPFWIFVGKLVDAMILGVIWLLCTLTGVLMGPATTALYYVSFKMVRDEESHVYKLFWKSFKENFRQAAIIGVINVVLAVLIVFDLYVYYKQESKISAYLFVLFLLLAFVWIIVSMYIYPLLSKFSNNIKTMYVMAFALSIKHFGTTLICLAIFVACAAVVYFVFPLIVFIGGVYIFLSSYPLRKVMDIYTQKILDQQAQLASAGDENDAQPDENDAQPDENDAQAEENDGQSEGEENKLTLDTEGASEEASPEEEEDDVY